MQTNLRVKGLLFLTFLFFSIGTAFSQTEETWIDSKIRLYLWDSGPAYTNIDPDTTKKKKKARKNRKTIHFYNNGELVKINLKTKRLSRPILYRGPQNLKLSSQLSDKGELINPKTLNVQNGKEFLAVMLPKGPDSFELFPVETGEKSLPPGHLKVINFCPTKLAARISVNNIVLEPLKSTIINIDDDLPKGAPFRIASWDNDEWKLVYSSTLTLSKSDKSLMVIYPEGRSWRRLLLTDL